MSFVGFDQINKEMNITQLLQKPNWRDHHRKHKHPPHSTRKKGVKAEELLGTKLSLVVVSRFRLIHNKTVFFFYAISTP
jgi:hypothetical protein